MAVTRRIGRYEILNRLAAGGMAEIFLAALRGPSRFERLVVVKRMLPHLAADRRFVQMFVDEARNLARIAHPNVVQIHDFGSDADELYLAMEYVDGENLASLMRQQKTDGENLEPPLAALIVAEACAGLHAAHELTDERGQPLGLIHRDISPHNVIATYDGHVKVLDFGIAYTVDRTARTDTGEVKGKLEYMSPEQLTGKPMDRRSDIFSIGIVLYELVTGRRLYDRPAHGSVVEAICHEPVVPPSRVVDGCSRALDDICIRALAKTPDERFATALEMRAALLEVAREIVDPTAALAASMRRRFQGRISEKSALVARLRGAQPPPSVAVEQEVLPTETMTSEPTEISPPPSRGRRNVIVLAVCALIAIGPLVAFGVARARRRVAPPPIASGAVVAAEPSSSAAPASSTIVVAVRTKPASARVLVDGEPRGETPIEIAVARGAAPVTVAVERPSFQPVTETIVPDRDQSLVFALVPATDGGRTRTTTRVPGRPRAPASAASPGISRFE